VNQKVLPQPLPGSEFRLFERRAHFFIEGRHLYQPETGRIPDFMLIT
jgi:hypothetical protein